MRRLVIATVLMAGMMAGCFKAEQQRSDEYESFLKRTLGVVQFEPAPLQQRAEAPHAGADVSN